MPQKRVSMRRIREVLRLLWDQGRSAGEVASACGMARSTVREYQRRASAAGWAWPLPDLPDSLLEAALFPPSTIQPGRGVEPDWASVNEELAAKGVTRRLLWEEYRLAHPEGYAYSRYCELFAAWLDTQEPSMRFHYPPGERLFIDYSGLTLEVVDPDSGEVRDAEVFVGALGFSHHTFGDVTWTQQLPDWIASHNRMFGFYGAKPLILVPDNLLSAVRKAHRYEPEINPVYRSFAEHNRLAVIPARSGKAKDKAVVEAAVSGVQRRVLAPLRHQRLIGLTQARDAIAPLLAAYNDAPFQKRPGSRSSLYRDVERAAMQPLVRERFVIEDWLTRKVSFDYHLSIENNHYSVPWRLIGKQVDVRVTAATIEVYFDGQRVASHLRSYRQWQFITVLEHMPLAHQEIAKINRESLLARAKRIGPGTLAFATALLESLLIPQQGYRTLVGVHNLERRWGRERLDSACQHALTIGALSCRSVTSILDGGLDQRPEAEEARKPKVQHDNVRGQAYYQARPPSRA